MKLKHMLPVVRFEHSPETPFSQEVHELRPGASRDPSPELSPSFLPLEQGTFESLAGNNISAPPTKIKEQWRGALARFLYLG